VLGDEVTLDLEVIHPVAPGAKLVVYTGSPAGDQLAVLFDALVNENPGAIISDSVGACETGLPLALLDAGFSSNNRALALGMSHYVASGDRGAYDCGQDKQAAVDFPAALPNVTAVGGTTVFQNGDGSYAGESCWGNALHQTSAGGGLSRNFKRPEWQQAPGVENASSNGYRQVPDVAGAADENTGWAIRLGGEDVQIGGTSAAAPLWAGVTALIDQALVRKGMKTVGFASPGLYWMARNKSRLPTPPFHEVTAGNNLLYEAAPGWNYCTGLGTMDAVAVEQGFEAYQNQAARR
jgi:kumamolisin